MCFNGIMDCVCTVENGPKPNEPMEKYFKRCWYYRPNHFNSGMDAFAKILRSILNYSELHIMKVYIYYKN